jgi:hypothetical protein
MDLHLFAKNEEVFQIYHSPCEMKRQIINLQNFELHIILGKRHLIGKGSDLHYKVVGALIVHLVNYYCSFKMYHSFAFCCYLYMFN